MAPTTKAESYRIARQQIEALLADANDDIAAMASVAAVLFSSLEDVSWVGFYRVVGTDRLRIGPYQGPVGCQEIPFGQGVCGTSAQCRETQVVDDVHAFPGHIACDPRSRSEIVVPVLDQAGGLVAVLDLDSHQPARFEEIDRLHLEEVVGLLRPRLGTQRPRA